MKNIILGIMCYTSVSLSCHAQDSKYSLTAKNDSLFRNQRMHNNKSIGLAGLTSDTLTWSQFTNSNAITLWGMESGEEITMYRLTVFYPNADVKEYLQWNDYLSDYTIREIIATGVKKILISDVTITRGKDDRNAGYRWFYFK